MLEKKVFETTINGSPRDGAGKKLSVEFNAIVSQANGAAFVTYGDTTILSTAVMSRNARETMEYFPLTVDYEEKYYAAGRILGSRFVRREGRPSEEAVLVGRLIDRTIRPLFDHRIRHDVQVVASTLSHDEEQSPDVTAIFAASIALLTSDIPWHGPVSAVRVGLIDEKFIINPTDAERAISLLDIVVSGGSGHINMLEGKAKEIPEDTFIAAVEVALKEINQLNAFQIDIARKIGKEKLEDLIRRVYRLDALNARYDEFMERYEPQNKPKSLFDMSAAYFAILKDDPQLPFALLPKDFLGEKAYHHYQSFMKYDAS